MKDRRSDYDITNTVQLTDTASVLAAVHDILSNTYLSYNQSALGQAFEDCEKLFEGDFPGYLPCDTMYHDKQHTMDMTLALARLIDGHERSVARDKRIGAERAVVGVITALYHDAGYIRELSDDQHFNGAEYTKIHVARSAKFLDSYMHKHNMGHYIQYVTKMVHYTGYEVDPQHLHMDDEKWNLLGYMLGTADLIAQMSDRCYLEKCRDRLYPELVLGGLSIKISPDGKEKILFQSGEDLLRRTPAFYEDEVETRLNKLFNSVYQFEMAHFDGARHYITGMGKNQAYLKKVLTAGDFSMLRRKPPENYGTRNFPGLEAYLDLHPLKSIIHG